MNQREYTFLKREEGQSFQQIAKDLKVFVYQVKGWYKDEQKKQDEKRILEYGIKCEERQTYYYNKLIWDTHHTEDWGVEYECQYSGCDSKIARKVLSHRKNFYAFLECTLCGRQQKWLKFPK